ncbi:DMT family transporter [Marinivivus vitaminiproducens]|uniref:DMT family transporter n=1 Tax=Marinivivus vitaminiproducens TaxID=3035935 RepID=UPI0027A2D36E|nr:DMT family transporter [Geminicoccaceae bacterium SCSIO 64248]
MPARMAVIGESRSAEFAIGLMLLAVFMFASNDALGKWLLGAYSVGQIMFWRSAAALIILAPYLHRAGWRTLFVVDRPWLHAARAVLLAIEVGAFYLAVSYMPLADTATFYMATPLFVTALSVRLLGETVGLRRWTGCAVGFLGVVLILRPTSAVVSWPALIALGGSVLFALALILTRKLKDSSGRTLLVWQLLGALALGGVALPFAERSPDFGDASLLCLLGAVATIAHVCANRSLQIAPASVVVPFQYTMIIWSALLGVLVFGDVPDLLLMAGAALIIGSGLYVFRREQTLARERRQAPASSSAPPSRGLGATRSWRRPPEA